MTMIDFYENESVFREIELSREQLESDIDSYDKIADVVRRLSRHDISIGRSTESLYDNFGIESSSIKDGVKNFFKKMADMFRKFVIFVKNVIGQIINWIQSAQVKSQATYYEKYRNFNFDISKANNVKMNNYAFPITTPDGKNLTNGIDKVNYLINAVSAVSANDTVGKVMEEYSKNVFRGTSKTRAGYGYTISQGGSVGLTAPISDATTKTKMDMNTRETKVSSITEVDKAISDALKVFNVVKSKDNGQMEASKWSGKKTFNYHMFGSDKPESKEFSPKDAIMAITGQNDPKAGFEKILSLKAAGEMRKVVEAGKKAIKQLDNDARKCERISNELAEDIRDNKAFTEISKTMTKMHSFRGIMVNNLFGCFSGYVKMRNIVFGIFKKCVGSDSNFSKNKSERKEEMKKNVEAGKKQYDEIVNSN